MALPMSLSPSRARDFQQCRLLFRYRAIDRVPGRPGIEAIRGTLVHRTLDLLFDLPAGERLAPAAVTLLEQAWRDVAAAEPMAVFALLPDAPFPDARADHIPTAEELAAAALDAREAADPDELAAAEQTLHRSSAALLRGYFALEDPRRLQPAQREQTVTAELDSGVLLRGQLDRIEVSPDGRTRIVDYKTGRPPAEGYESDALFQLRTYALILWRSSGRIPDLLRLLYLGGPAAVDDHPTEERLAIVDLRLTHVWQQIEQAAATGSWPATRSRLCDWCAYRAACPEWGAPALPLA